MVHDHPHQGATTHEHSHATGGRALTRALGLTLGFAFVEAAVGFLSGSLALVSDAGHMLVDSGALGLALFAQRLAARPRTALYTFGYRRAEVLAAAISGGALFTASIGIVIEALSRLRTSHEVRGDWMLGTALMGLLVNLASGAILMGGAHASINIRAALAHVAADAAGSVAAIVASVAVLKFNLPQADAVASILISMLILWGSTKLMRESAAVLMEPVADDMSCRLRRTGVCLIARSVHRCVLLAQSLYADQRPLPTNESTMPTEPKTILTDYPHTLSDGSYAFADVGLCRSMPLMGGREGGRATESTGFGKMLVGNCVYYGLINGKGNTAISWLLELWLHNGKRKELSLPLKDCYWTL